MKRGFFLLFAGCSLAACNNGGKVELGADTLEQKLNTSVGKIEDSVKAKGERTLEAVKDKINNLGKKSSPVEVNVDTAR